jgi:PAS domain S-box-containing protein
MRAPDRRDGASADQTFVLHVDDEPTVSELVADHLEHRDDSISVITEQRAEEGLTHLTDEPIHCVVSDYDMPGTNGLEFLREVRDIYPNLPFVLFTARGNEEVASEAIEAGVTDYLQKGGAESYDLLHRRIQHAVNHSRAESRAKLARDQLHAIFEHINGFYAVDEDWTVTYWNEWMATQTGYPPEAVVGEKLWRAYPEIRGTEVGANLQRVMETDEPAQFEAYVDAEEQWLEVHAYPVETGVFVQSRDVTEKRERIRELERRNQRLESVARTLSHDLQNPLNVAEGRLDLAERTGKLTHLDDVANAHNQMQNLISDLLRLARDEELDVDEVVLESVVEEAWSFAETGLARLAFDVDDDVHLLADRGQIQRVFENLFENADEHGDASTVRVGLLDDDSGLYVEDDGEGLPDTDRDVFESGVSTAADGTGYGLAIVEQVVEEHGWTVRVCPSDDGGTRFELVDVEFA